MGDVLRELAVGQGWVPKGCTLPGQLIHALMLTEDPCLGCNEDRGKCGGRQKGDRPRGPTRRQAEVIETLVRGA